MKPTEWIAEFFRKSPPSISGVAGVAKNVDWQHRVKVLEDEITAKDELLGKQSKVVEQLRGTLDEREETISGLTTDLDYVRKHLKASRSFIDEVRTLINKL